MKTHTKCCQPNNFPESEGKVENNNEGSRTLLRKEI